jgi:non-homologous end joining protein Ku
MKDFMVLKDDELERLEEEIKENIEWLSTIDDDEIECIGIENLEGILTRFFHRKISLTLG